MGVKYLQPYVPATPLVALVHRPDGSIDTRQVIAMQPIVTSYDDDPNDGHVEHAVVTDEGQTYSSRDEEEDGIEFRVCPKSEKAKQKKIVKQWKEDDARMDAIEKATEMAQPAADALREHLTVAQLEQVEKHLDDLEWPEKGDQDIAPLWQSVSGDLGFNVLDHLPKDVPVGSLRCAFGLARILRTPVEQEEEVE